MQFITTDVFTHTPYIGNPLAIVRAPPSTNLSQDQKQAIAREFNLSETVILHETEESFRTSEWTADIFTKTVEIPLAGHPVIGTSCYLGRTLQASGASGTIKGTLKTKAGPVAFEYETATKTAAAAIPHNSHIHDRKFDATEASQYNFPPEVAKSMVKPASFVSIVKGMTFCCVEMPDLETLGEVRLPLGGLTSDGLNQEYFQDGLLGFFFYCKQGESEGAVKIRTRMLKESLEDPATGSASSALCVFLALTETKRQVQKFELTQAVEMGRQSEIGVEVTLDSSGSKVEKCVLSGSAVGIMEGSIVVPP